jgi:hypothetical protein
MSMSDVSKQPCGHLPAVHDVMKPQRYVCDECVKVGGRWVHLRTCQTCGLTLCCDNSPSRHARAHAGSQARSIVLPH